MDDLFYLGISTLAATLRLATPLILCAMAGLLSERAGVIDIGLEGKMLAGAFAAAVTAALTGSPYLALLAGLTIAAALSLLHGLASITYRGDQVVSGVAINIIAMGLTVVLGNAWFGRGGNTPDLNPEQRFMPLQLPGAADLREVPLIGPFYADVVSGHSLLTYLALLLVPLIWFLLYRTRFGLRLRAVGEAPAVVDTAGISVLRLRYSAVILAGLLCGLAGTFLAIAQNAAFQREMTAGRGFIALAAMIFGKWRPWPAFFACLLFGFLDAVAIRLQGAVIPGIGPVPVPLIQALPYILTVILLAGFIGKALAPKALGRPYVKER
ncbi:nucleoside ABC transporter membrane protein [Dongia mobilis]|uniref:Nucleoside ABC transporter membrane protein n=1 Tax=Dongia mobilis TaxID=578943 RepID=A0A4R6WVT9_9PROT|nr:ABC transporter permease [Dongia mobilis]TDQ84300.1 nucleoside ABC transporter membrane protein [Dongia mobilis]